jgi:two-component system response regulator YesN
VILNLIIVDDEKTTRNNLLTRIPWAELGIESVKNAANGLSALAIAENFRPSILLTDIRMPKMDGIELSKNIRQLYPDCEIIFLSGYTDN